MTNKDERYGWICPKCGCPNAPSNKTCVACFSPFAGCGKKVYESPTASDAGDDRKFLVEDRSEHAEHWKKWGE